MYLILIFSVVEALKSELFELLESKVAAFSLRGALVTFLLTLNVLFILLVKVVLVGSVRSVVVVFVEPALVEEHNIGDHSVT